MGLFHSPFKLKMSKSQTDHVAFKSAPSPETCVSHYSLVPKPGGGRRKLRQTGEDTSHQQKDFVAHFLG